MRKFQFVGYTIISFVIFIISNFYWKIIFIKDIGEDFMFAFSRILLLVFIYTFFMAVNNARMSGNGIPIKDPYSRMEENEIFDVLGEPTIVENKCMAFIQDRFGLVWVIEIPLEKSKLKHFKFVDGKITKYP